LGLLFIAGRWFNLWTRRLAAGRGATVIRNWVSDMAAEGSKVVIFAAMAGNLCIAITKFVAGYFTRSSAMIF
jgi:hypothetical protein